MGQTQTRSAKLVNAGSTQITLSRVYPAAPGFSLNDLSLPMTLAAGQSVQFNVSFRPGADGRFDSNFELINSTPNGPFFFDVHGNGVTGGILGASPSSISFGSVQPGKSATLPETLTNSGRSNVTINQATVTGSAYSLSGLTLPATLTPGQSTSFSVRFAPTTGGSASGSLSITSNASNPSLGIPLSGTGVTPGSLTATATSLSFGSVQVGNSQTLSETLTNSGSSSVTVSQVNAAGAGFSVSGLSLPLTLTRGQSFTFGAVFTPTAGGRATGSISVISTASNPSLTISLSGAGVASGQLIESPASLNFSNVTVGRSKSLPVTLSTTGSSVTISSATTNNSEFTLNGLTFPFTLAAGQSVSLNLTFTPQSTGTTSGSISFVSNASNSPTAESVTGSGISTVSHSVNLTWDPSSSTVIGYNVYRGPVSGGPYFQINPTLDPSTAYTDSTVVGGNTYYYVSTSVDSSGIESIFSNQVKAVIPAP